MADHLAFLVLPLKIQSSGKPWRMAAAFSDRITASGNDMIAKFSSW